MPGRPPSCDRGEATRMAMLHFWKEGFARSSVEDLVRKTGLNRFSIYGEFRGKKGLFLKACQAYSDCARDHLFHPLLGAKDPESGLQRLFATVTSNLLDTSRPSGCLIMNALADETCRDPKVRELLGRHFSAIETAFVACLGKIPKATPGGKKRGAAILLNTLMGLTYQARLSPNKRRLDAIAGTAIAAALATAKKP